MEKIFIDNKDWSGLVLSVISLFFVSIGFLISGSDWSTTFVVMGVLIIVIYLSRPYWFKNYIKFSKHYIYIRFATRKGASIKFSEIRKFDFLLNTLIITTKNDNCYVFNTKGISSYELKNLEIILNDELENKSKENNYQYS